MKLFLVRHGQTTANQQQFYAGQTDVPLTEQGRQEAEAIRPILAKFTFDRVYSSDLIRAMHTAELAIPGCIYETTPLLREVGMGSLELQPIAEVEADMRSSYWMGRNYTTSQRIRIYPKILNIYTRTTPYIQI